MVALRVVREEFDHARPGSQVDHILRFGFLESRRRPGVAVENPGRAGTDRKGSIPPQFIAVIDGHPRRPGRPASIPDATQIDVDDLTRARQILASEVQAGEAEGDAQQHRHQHDEDNDNDRTHRRHPLLGDLGSLAP